MTTDLLAALAFALVAVLLLETPRRAFIKAGGAEGFGAYDAWLGAGLFAVGFAVFKSGLGGYFADQMMLSLACEVLAAVVYANLRFLITPNLYSGLLLALALGHAFNTGGWAAAGLGAVACGVAGVTLILGAGFLRGVRGVGPDDAKLAVGVGALLGWAWGLGAIAGSLALTALGTAGLLLVRRLKPGDEGSWPAPLGAGLAVACGLALWWSLM